MKIYQKISQAYVAMTNCEKTCNTKAYEYHRKIILDIEKEYLPHGSGFDAFMLITQADDKKININFDYHLMNNNGYYDGWINLDMIITPNLSNNFDMQLKNWYKKDNDKSKVQKYKPILEDYFYDEFYHYLIQEYKEPLTNDINQYNVEHHAGPTNNKIDNLTLVERGGQCDRD